MANCAFYFFPVGQRSVIWARLLELEAMVSDGPIVSLGRAKAFFAS